jgi:hypothetical protein
MIYINTRGASNFVVDVALTDDIIIAKLLMKVYKSANNRIDRKIVNLICGRIVEDPQCVSPEVFKIIVIDIYENKSDEDGYIQRDISSQLENIILNELMMTCETRYWSLLKYILHEDRFDVLTKSIECDSDSSFELIKHWIDTSDDPEDVEGDFSFIVERAPDLQLHKNTRSYKLIKRYLKRHGGWNY